MPIYEYHCKKCGDFEVMQKMSDAPLSECPTCNRKVQKLISSTSFQLKGSGWYITDYARKGSSGGKADNKADKKSADAKPEAKETKTETKEAKSDSTSSSDTGSSSKSEKAAAA